MSGADLDALARELCRVFLGWKLGADEPALRGLGEGALRIDLLRGEAWCDGEPLPSLFIAEERRRTLEAGLAGVRLEEAVLEAVFAVRAPGLHRRKGTLEIGCACLLRDGGASHRAEARRGEAHSGATGNRSE